MGTLPVSMVPLCSTARKDHFSVTSAHGGGGALSVSRTAGPSENREQAGNLYCDVRGQTPVLMGKDACEVSPTWECVWAPLWPPLPSPSDPGETNVNHRPSNDIRYSVKTWNTDLQILIHKEITLTRRELRGLDSGTPLCV